MNDKRTVDEIDALAQEIRRVDGENSLGAGALAEALQPFLTELQHRREGTCKSCNGTGGEYNLCSDCGGSGIEFVYGGHGNVLEVPCSTCAAFPSSPASGVRVSDDEIEAIHQVYLAKVREYDADFRRDDKPDDFWEKKYGTRLHSTGLGERWALRCALETVALAKSALGEHP